jgi:hypothetical protein
VAHSNIFECSYFRPKGEAMHVDDEPFEGANTMGLTIALGSLGLLWPKYDQYLFGLFCHLAEMPMIRGRVVWFNLASLDSKLTIMDQLIAEGTAEGDLMARLTHVVKAARSISKRRNKWVHWHWDRNKSDGDWSIVSFKHSKPDAFRMSVRSDDVLEVIREIGDEIAKMPELYKEVQASYAK